MDSLAPEFSSRLQLDANGQAVNRSFSVKRKPIPESGLSANITDFSDLTFESHVPSAVTESGEALSSGPTQERNEINSEQRIAYPDGSVFQGQVSEHGIPIQGTLNYHTGNKFVGEFGRHGKPIRGTLLFYDSGDEDVEFEGKFQDGKPYQGVLKFVNGRTVEEAKCDEEGSLVEGKETLPNGEVFTGTFVENRRRKGTVRYSNGKVYTGTFKQGGRQFDEGKMNYPNGCTFDGSWVAGQKGRGVLTWPMKGGTASLQGEFNSESKIREGTTAIQIQPNGQFEGTFHQTGHFNKGIWRESDGFKFEGTFDENGKYKEGHQWYPSGTYYHGTFINNLKAEGEMHTPKHDRFVGTFRNGKLSKGKYYFADDKRGYYSGTFGPDQQFAIGLITLPSGTVYDVDGAKREYNHKLTKANLKAFKTQGRSGGSRQLDGATADRVRGEINNMVDQNMFWQRYNNC